MKKWKSTSEQLPEVGQKVWYHYAYIGTWDGVYLGEIEQKYYNKDGEDVTDQFGDEPEILPSFESSGGCWVTGCETFWCERDDDVKPDTEELYE